MIAKNARIKIVNLTETYDYQQFQQDNRQAVPLFTIDKNNVLRVVSAHFQPNKAAGFKVVALVEEETDEQ